MKSISVINIDAPSLAESIGLVQTDEERIAKEIEKYLRNIFSTLFEESLAKDSSDGDLDEVEGARLLNGATKFVLDTYKDAEQVLAIYTLGALTTDILQEEYDKAYIKKLQNSLQREVDNISFDISGGQVH